MTSAIQGLEIRKSQFILQQMINLLTSILVYPSICKNVCKSGSKVYSESSQTFKMELFVKIANCFHQLTIFAKISIFDDWVSSEHMPDRNKSRTLIGCSNCSLYADLYRYDSICRWLNVSPKNTSRGTRYKWNRKSSAPYKLKFVYCRSFFVS